MAVIETQQAREAAERAERAERIAKGFREQGRTAEARRVSSRAQSEQQRAARLTEEVNRNIPQPTGSVEYVRQKRDDRSETGSYEPVSVRRDGNKYIVEKRGLLRDPSKRGYTNQVYVKERIVYDESGKVLSREVYDTYKTESGRERSYLRLKETPTQRREIVLNSKGDKIRDEKTNLTTGETRSERLNPNERAERTQALSELGLTAEEIKRLSPGQQKAVLDERNAGNYTSTPVPKNVLERVNAQLGGKVSTVREGESQQLFQGKVLDLGAPQFLGVRAIPLSEQQSRGAAERLIETRKEAGVYQSERGTILIREGGKKGQVASQIFKDLGAPERKLIGDITFGRDQSYLVKREGILPEVSFFKSGAQESSRRSQIFETKYDIPDARTAKFAGFPTRNEGGESVQFPARFTVTQENREDFAREGVFDKPSAYVEKKFQAIDNAAAGTPLGKGIQGFGSGVKKIGEKVETLKATEGKIQIIEPTAKFVGGALQEVGSRIEERPVTFGVGQAVLFGTGFGAVSKGALALRSAGYVSKAGAEIKKAGRLARFARGTGAGILATEKAAGIGLGLGFAGQTAVQTYAAPTTQERGRVIAGAGFEVLGFAGGYKAGRGLVSTGLETAAKADNTIFKKTQNLETGEVRRALRPELERGLETIENAAIKPLEKTYEGIEFLAPGRRGEIGGRSAKQRSGRVSKAEMRKQSFNQAYNRQVTFSQGEIVARVRNEQLKQNFVKERVVRVDPLSQQITGVSDKGLRSDLPQLKGQGTPMSAKKLYGGKRGPGGVQSQALAGLGRQLKVDYGAGESFVARRSSRSNIFERPKEERREAPQVTSGGGEQVTTQRLAIQQRAKLEMERQKRQPIRKSEGGRSLAELYGGKKQQKVPEVEEFSAPQEWQDLRPQESAIFRGSPLDRKVRAFSRLREMAREREQQVSGQLPATTSTREVTVFEPGKSEISRVINAERALNVRRMGEVSALKPALDLSVSGAERFRSPLDVALGQNTKLSFTTIQSAARTQVQEPAVLPDTLADQIQDQGVIGGGAEGTGRSESRREERRPPLLGGGEPGRRGLSERTSEILPKPTAVPTLELKGKERFEKGYFALVKRFGKFEKVTAVPLGKEEALAVGLNVAEGGAGQTVKLIEARESVRASTGSGFGARGLAGRFTSLGKGLYREKRKYAINTPGELQEITFKGLASRRGGLRV